ncbi:MAG TPA: RNA polymerase sigma-70 factor [Parasegetibacter sp.]
MELQGSEKEEQFAQIFHQYRDKVYSIALRMTESVELAEDIVQDVFLQLWLHSDKLSDLTHFKAYLFTTTRNHVYNALKKKAIRESTPEIITAPLSGNSFPADDVLLNKEYSTILNQAIAQLPEQQEKVYRLTQFEQLKRDEIARIMNISPETVKQHLAQARRNLRSFCISQLASEGKWGLITLYILLGKNIF